MSLIVSHDEEDEEAGRETQSLIFFFLLTSDVTHCIRSGKVSGRRSISCATGAHFEYTQ